MDDSSTTQDIRFSLAAPAKINVFLEVLGKRDDGFHELETVMLRTDFCDTLTFASCHSDMVALALAEGSVVNSNLFPLNESNLIAKAAKALKQATGCAQGASITVKKLIPAEAGLAGGSSNAASALMGLNRLWKLQLSKPELHQIAATLGSDVNFFIEDCSAAICRGRGELVQPIAVGSQLHFVAVHPGAGNSTPEVFGKLDALTSTHTSEAVVAAIANGDAHQLVLSIFNRLTSAAMTCNSAMKELLDSLTELTRKPAYMSGSGSTCFVVANSQQEAIAVESLLKQENVGLVMRFSC